MAVFAGNHSSARSVASSTQSAGARAASMYASVRPSTGSGVGKASRETRGLISGSSSLPGTSTLDDYWKRIQSITEANNAWSAAQAQKQMDFQQASAREAMKFNHDEAELNRLWQERMSNTSHQREIKDLQAAGLNPVLSAMGGSGAPVTSGATASGYTSQGAKGDTDTSAVSALVSLVGTIMQTQASMLNTLTSAQTQERVAKMGFDSDVFRALTSAASAREVTGMNNQTSRDVASLQARTSLVVTGMNNETSKIMAQISAGAQVASSRIHAAGQAAAAQISGQYNLSAAKTNQLTSIITHAMDNASKEGIASANRTLQRELQSNDFDFRMAFAEDQYTRDWKLHMWDNGTDILQSIIGGIGSSGYGSTGSGLLGLLKYFG